MQVSVLCGGKSSRMRSEKGLSLYNDKPFIAHIVEAVLSITTTIRLIWIEGEIKQLFQNINSILELDELNTK